MHRPIIGKIIQVYWDTYCEEEMQRYIRGFKFSIDMGDCKPITCKIPRYRPHEARVINKLIQALKEKELIEDDTRPYRAMIVLASKPSQGHVNWSQFVFCLCKSYQPLNAMTRLFLYPVTVKGASMLHR